MNITEEELKTMLSNPFYCLSSINKDFTVEHKTIITEDVFIKAGAKLIEEIGAEEYIKRLLNNLK